MKQKNDQIVDFFSSHLENVEMPLEHDLWDDLEKELTVAHKRIFPYKWVGVAASVVVVLAMGATYMLTRMNVKEATKKAFAYNVPKLKTVSDLTDWKAISSKQNLKNGNELALADKSAKTKKIKAMEHADEDSLVHVTVTFSQVEYGHVRHNDEQADPRRSALLNGSTGTDNPTESLDLADQSVMEHHRKALSMDAYISAYAKENLTYGVGISKKISDKLALVSGLTYSTADVKNGGKNQKYIGIPVKLRYDLLGNSDKGLSLYAEGGAKLDQCISGGCNTDVALVASLGMKYSFDKKLALYAEPDLAYNIDNGSSISSNKQQHTFSPGISCGIRLTY